MPLTEVILARCQPPASNSRNGIQPGVRMKIAANEDFREPHRNPHSVRLRSRSSSPAGRERFIGGIA